MDTAIFQVHYAKKHVLYQRSIVTELSNFYIHLMKLINTAQDLISRVQHIDFLHVMSFLKKICNS